MQRIFNEITWRFEWLLWAVKRTFKKILWMFKVKDCRQVCLFCEYFDRCQADVKKERRMEE